MGAPLDTGWIAAHVPGEGGRWLDNRPTPAMAPRGTLLMEFALPPARPGAVRLVHLAMRDPARLLSIAVTTERRIEVIQRQGTAFHALSIDASAETAAGGRMRLSWRWDDGTGQSLLTLEALDQGTLRQAAGFDPLPMPGEDLAALAAGTGAARIGMQLDWLAIGDHLHPVGPGGCFAPTTMLDTPQGPRPASAIQAGDMVLTVDAGAQTVLWSGRVCLPALGALRPVRLCAPRFGQTRDLWLLPQHRLSLGGADEVLIEARHLIDGRTALQPDGAPVMAWHGILLDQHHLLIADGCRIESLGLGRLARSPALAATTALADLAAEGRLPLHPASVRPILSEAETRLLLAGQVKIRSARAA